MAAAARACAAPCTSKPVARASSCRAGAVARAYGKPRKGRGGELIFTDGDQKTILLPYESTIHDSLESMEDYRPQRVVVADTASEASAAPAPAPVPASVPTPAPAQAVPDRPGSLAGPSSAGELATAVTSHAVAVMTPLLNPDKASARRLVEAWKQRRMASSTKASSTGATRTSSATESTKPPLRSRPQTVPTIPIVRTARAVVTAETREAWRAVIKGGAARAHAEAEGSAGGGASAVGKGSPLPGGTLLPLAALCVAEAMAVLAMDFGYLRVSDPFAGSLSLLLATSGLASLVWTQLGSPLLRRMGLRQRVREDGPAAHLSKGGTTTAGGLLFVPIGVLLGLWAANASPETLAVATAAAAFGAVGLVDDFFTVWGATRRLVWAKLAVQCLAASALCVAAHRLVPGAALFSSLPLWPAPQGHVLLAVGPTLYWLLSGATIVAEANGVNLTDGMDGLAAGVCSAAFLATAVGASASAPSLAPLLVAVAGSCLGFAFLNRFPASVFMGNAGSLALGAMLGTAAAVTRQFGPVLLATLVPAVEAASVLVQVLGYKATKRGAQGVRVFRMAPLHHHFELGGTHETRVTSLFWAASVLCGAASVALAAGTRLS